MSEQSERAPELGDPIDVSADGADAARYEESAPAAGTPGPGEETMDTPDDLGGTGGDEGGAG
jgi:hypothetical protein